MKTVNYRGASEVTGLAERTLRNLVSRKQIPHFKLGKSVRFSVERLEAWMDERAVEPLKKTLHGGI